MKWTAAVGAGVLAFGEIQAWRTSRAGYPRHPATGPTDGADVVLVLGFRSREDGRLNALQAWRTRIAVRSASPDALFVFSGGAVRGSEPEAVVMARYATKRLGVAPDAVALEPAAQSTRENLSLSLPWLRAARTIRIASNTAHARRARDYLRELDPHLWQRLRPTRDFRPLELGPLRLALTFYDFVARRSAGRTMAVAAAERAVTPPARSTAQRSGATDA
ncbi:YdcF family protein [Microbacterium sp. VKM Ac-2870]|uniref:YdcF family protein n=1 Tax=Microbacterium sp. VKM Ac-2870 TaxID=2783825 RepID=UPI001E330773|nr:YdcF family protein [Microbacterium sp. VKM Ac-2870]